MEESRICGRPGIFFIMILFYKSFYKIIILRNYIENLYEYIEIRNKIILLIIYINIIKKNKGKIK